MALGVEPMSNGISGRHDDDASRRGHQVLQRAAASSALRRLVLAAAACDGAAGAAATAADEIAKLRADVAKASAREERRMRVISCNNGPRDRERERQGAEAERRAAMTKADAAQKQVRAALRLQAPENASAEREREASAALEDMKAELLAARRQAHEETSAARELQLLLAEEQEARRETNEDARGLGFRLSEVEAQMQESDRLISVLKQSEVEARASSRQAQEDLLTTRTEAAAKHHEVSELRQASNEEASAAALAAECLAEASHERVQRHTQQEEALEALAREHGETVAFLHHREAVARSLLATFLSSHLEGLLRGALIAWQGAKARSVQKEEHQEALEEARRVGELRISLQSALSELQASRQKASHEAKIELRTTLAEFQSARSEASALAVALRNHESAGCEARSLAEHLARREEAFGHMLASLLASHAEVLLHGAFCAWREAGADQRRRDALLAAQKLEVSSALEEASSFACLMRSKEEDHARLESHQQALADNATKMDAEAERLRKSLQEALAEVQIERQSKLEHSARLMEDMRLEMDVREEQLLHREDNARRVLSTLIAVHFEQQVGDAFFAWRHALAGSAAAKASEERVISAVSETQDEALELRRELTAATSEHNVVTEAAELAKVSALSEADAARAQAAASARETSRLKEEFQSALAAQALASSSPSASSAALAVAAMAEHEEAVAKSIAFYEARTGALQNMVTSLLANHFEQMLRGVLTHWAFVVHSGKSDASSRAPAAAHHERSAAVARQVVISLLASQLEALVLGSLSAWRDAVRRGDARGEGPAWPAQPESQRSERWSHAGATPQELELSSDLLVQREMTVRNMLATLLSNHMESFMRGIFSCWRLATTHELMSAKEIVALRNSLSVCLAEVEKYRKAALDAHQEEQAGSKEKAESTEIQSEVSRLRVEAEHHERGVVAARKVLVALLASQLEVIVRGAFCTWQDRCRAGGSTESQLADAKRASPSSASEISEALEHRRVAVHSVLSTLLSSQLEALIRGVFFSWKLGMTCEVLGVEEVATLRTAKEELGAHRRVSAIDQAYPTEAVAALARLEAELKSSCSDRDGAAEFFPKAAKPSTSAAVTGAECPDVKKMVDGMMASTKFLQHREEAANRGFQALSQWNRDLVLRASFFAWRKARELRRSTPRKPGRLTMLESEQHELKQRLATLGQDPSPDSPAGSSFSASGISPSASATPTVPSAPAALALDQKLSKASSEEGDMSQDRRPTDSNSEPEF